MPTYGKWEKIILLPEEEQFIRDNYESMTNQQLADALGLKLTKCRGFLYAMGLKRMELEYWTEEQTEWLKRNFYYYGDVEIAEIFNQLWPKNKSWTLKHIEKKRKYLILNRSKENLHDVYLRNKIQGRWKMCPVKRWEACGSAEIGHIFWWDISSSGKKYPVIKTENGYFHYYRYIYTEANGKLRSDQFVVPKKDAPEDMLLLLEHLEVIDRAEHAARNREKRMQVPAELREIISLTNKLRKTIKSTQNETRNQKKVK